ncbi:DUF3850 domain-containing protein [Carnobacterium maltaromaticum]|uniref:DUF3850 domain-containing protein n=1 Tax=Carnobacterium maltaromaticum TaxID=2751 RepID=UPI00378C042C
MIHALKTESCYFWAVRNKIKTFEIRVNDRNYQVNDCLLLKEIDENNNFTGQKTLVQITYTCDYLQQENILVLGIL